MSTPTLVPGSYVGENDKYRVVRLLGEGGMGVVFEAEHTVTQKRVALKWMRPELASAPDVGARFLREAQAAARVRHPNVVDIYDYGRHGDAAYLVMEYLEGETLTQALHRADLPWSTLLGLLLPVMHAVAAAHKQGVVHRDIKPDNIFLSRHGALVEAKLLDFGISKLEARGSEALSLTRTGTTMGTPNYMSYEQLIGEKQVDGRTDVYAFGVILYEILTGRLPFEAETFSALVVKVATSEPLPAVQLRPDLPPALQKLLQWVLAKDREQRCPSMDALIAALEPFAAGVSGASYAPAAAASTAAALAAQRDSQQRKLAPAASTMSSAQAHARSRVPLLFAGVLALLLALCAVALFAWERSSPRASSEPPRLPATPTPAAAAGGTTLSNPSQLPAQKPRSEAARALPPGPAQPELPTGEAPVAPGEAAARHHQRAPHEHSAATPLPAGAAAPDAAESGESSAEKAGGARSQHSQDEAGWYVTPEGRRVMRAPLPGAAAPSDTQRAPYTTPNGRVVIPAP